jgi:translation initiation factor eIF-2B subunit delta
MSFKHKSLPELKRILSDNTSGSTDLVRKLNKWVRKHYRDLQLINEMIKRVRLELKSFAAVDSYLKKLKKINSKKDSTTIKNFSIDFDERLKETYYRLYLNARKEIGKVNIILTISNSRTLKEVFTLWGSEEKNLKFIITESRPNYEGRLLAKEILKNKLKVELITEAMLSLFIPRADAVIIGADKILKNGNVINKVGSLSAAVLCKYYKKPFYVLATKDKFTKEKQLKSGEKNSKEIWNYRHSNLKITNIYFEEIDKSLITKIITESH